jgi:hypothetical protein
VLERGREGRTEGESGGEREGGKQVSGVSVGLVSGAACFSSVSEACVVSGEAEKLEAKEEEVKLQVTQDLRLAALAYEEVCVCVCVRERERERESSCFVESSASYCRY